MGKARKIEHAPAFLLGHVSIILEYFQNFLFILTFPFTTHIIILTHLTRLEGESGFCIAITGFYFVLYLSPASQGLQPTIP